MDAAFVGEIYFSGRPAVGQARSGMGLFRDGLRFEGSVVGGGLLWEGSPDPEHQIRDPHSAGLPLSSMVCSAKLASIEGVETGKLTPSGMKQEISGCLRSYPGTIPAPKPSVFVAAPPSGYIQQSPFNNAVPISVTSMRTSVSLESAAEKVWSAPLRMVTGRVPSLISRCTEWPPRL